MGSEASPAIEARGLTKRYGKLLAVDSIDFDIIDGEVFGFLGPNGAGKTTTVMMLTTFLEPTAGTIRIHGYDVSREPLRARALMGIVPEESNIYTELLLRVTSFSVRRGVDLSPQTGIVHLMAMILFFTASTAGPVILILERRTLTLDRLMTAPLSMACLLFGKTLVGVLFAVVVALIPLTIGLFVFHIRVHNPALLGGAIILSAMSFSALGVWSGSFPVRSVGSVMMPSTLLRWPLLFVSGIFIPLERMPIWARTISYISPLTYSHDVVKRAVSGSGCQPAALDMVMLPAFLVLFLFLAVRLYRRVRRLGY